jgi:hypothetical protein
VAAGVKALGFWRFELHIFCENEMREEQPPPGSLV